MKLVLALLALLLGNALLLGLLDGIDDVLIACAAAEVARDLSSDLLPARLRLTGDDGNRSHDETGGAEAALDSPFINEGLLDVADRPLGVTEALEGKDVLAFGPDSHIDAGVERFAVDQDGTGTALTHIATVLDAVKSSLFPEHVGERLPDIHTIGSHLAVYGARNVFLSH